MLKKQNTAMNFVLTFFVPGMLTFSAACGDRLNATSCPQMNVIENKPPIPQVACAGDKEIPSNKDSADPGVDEGVTDTADATEKTTANDTFDRHDTEDTGGARPGDSENRPNTAARVFHLSKGHILLVDKKEASIIDKNDRVLCKNETLIRKQDENGICISDGFRSVKVIDGGFVLLQQNCGGQFFIMETSEYKYSSRGDAVYLTQFVLEYVDKTTDEHESKFYRLTAEDFGKIRFEQVNWAYLYDLAWNEGE